MIDTSTDTTRSNFLDSFTNIISGDYLDTHNKTKLDLFVLNINANEFDYENLKNRLVDPVVDFALSRKIKEKYKDRPATQSKKAREKFKQEMNTGELGEFLLFCFLENHLGAPKILTKLELKTSTSQYVHGSDGVHFLRLPDGNYQVIFGESKTESSFKKALDDAFQSIYDFKNCINEKGKPKSGLPYEKSLISDEIEKEIFTDEEKEFIESLIYPKADSEHTVDDAFGIFIAYNMTVSDADKKLSNADFRSKIHKRVEQAVRGKYQQIKGLIANHGLAGHHFYIYILPFSDLGKARKEITEHMIS